jgi:hypothetical protein
MLEFDRDQFGFAQGPAAEEIRRIVILPEELPFRILDHRRQLVQVADHQQLHAAEGQRRSGGSAQDMIHPVEQVGPHHADLVDHQQVEALDDVDLFPAVAMLAEIVRCRGYTVRMAAGKTSAGSRRRR